MNKLLITIAGLMLASCAGPAESEKVNDTSTEQTDTVMKPFVEENLVWTREPKVHTISDTLIAIVTEPNTDLWQRTYYGFQNDNAPVLQMKTDRKYFSFVVKTKFEDSSVLFDQCGIAIYLDSENWAKASIEYENEQYQRLGSVVTNNGYSDWATTDIPATTKEMWYRLSRRASDYCIETSADGESWQQMRIFHLFKGDGEITFGIYAASPSNHSFKAEFTNMQMLECQWAGWQAE